MQYEYIELKFMSQNYNKAIDELNKLGKEGWKLVDTRYTPEGTDNRTYYQQKEYILMREIST